MSYEVDKAAKIVARIASYRQNEVRFRISDVTCPRCRRLLGVYYCEGGIYAVKCQECETVTLLEARSPSQAAARVGVIARPLDEWTEDEGDVITMRFPIRDTSDIAIGYPNGCRTDIPEDHTHFISLPCPVAAWDETGGVADG